MKKQYRINGTIKVTRYLEAESAQEAIEIMKINCLYDNLEIDLVEKLDEQNEQWIEV